MDFALLILYLAFITIVCYLVSYTVRNMCKHKDNKIRRSSYGFTKEKAKEISDRTELVYKIEFPSGGSLVFKDFDTDSNYSIICTEHFYNSLMYKDGSEVQEKYKETLPKHSTRIKNRNKRKEKK